MSGINGWKEEQMCSYQINGCLPNVYSLIISLLYFFVMGLKIKLREECIDKW